VTLRASVSKLEAFRLFRDEEWMSFADLLATLRGETPEKPEMSAGSALHSILEVADGPIDYAEMGGFEFLFELPEDAPALDLLPLRELPAARVYQIGSEEVTVRMRCDAFDGTRVDDHKLRSKTFDAQKYADSYQWRLYLSVLGVSVFRYNCFCGRPDRKNPNRWTIREFHPLTLHRYPEMEDDVRSLISDYARFYREHEKEIAA
jgi:hypothetical protein